MSGKAQWYVVHTYSGYENKVAANLEKIIENRRLEDVILDVRVPTETVVEKTEKGIKERERKIFPSYILVKMVMTNDTWFIVRNTSYTNIAFHIIHIPFKFRTKWRILYIVNRTVKSSLTVNNHSSTSGT